ncbi:MAG: UDP-N-acetylmuramoyl-L-alanyl-D-glutamate--2,6-diaminopimelate ligase [Sterolibacterium sp.]|nr:UDP-N-acetylmuramoyl-L-alanyl-D-glutamate--2,6-diaminopimelate ligase [Sterolibacterium sp.]
MSSRIVSVSEIFAGLERQGVRLAGCGISADSRRITQGDVFVALPGVRGDGRDHIEAAVQQGAAGVIWENADARDCAALLDNVLRVPNVPVAGLQAVLGALANAVHGQPSAQMWVCGITGTNGKTTVSQWIVQALNMLGRRCGVIGTLGNGLPGALVDSLNTTPDVISVHATLAGLRDAGATACAMEVSSIGLDQQRVDGVHFDTAIFTNLTRDHLEYHGNILNYGAAKARLFELPGIRHAIFNLDDPLGSALAENLAGRGVRRIGYTLDEDCPHAASVDQLLIARDLQVGGQGFSFNLSSAVDDMPALLVNAALLGRFNASNLLAVLAALLAAGVPPAEAAACCRQLTPPPGRLQIVNAATASEAPLLVVDYAHTPDALEQVLLTLREVATARAGRLLCVFGCGGERDSGKRPLMGRVAERLADEVVVTSDNPRGEDPQRIINNILDGMTRAARSEMDRSAAIASVVRNMQPQDVLLIAGKGHESYQEIAGERLPFSDLAQAQQALSAWRAEP